MDYKTILNPQDAKIIHIGNASVLKFHFMFRVNLPEGYDYSDYVIIRTKDLDAKTQNKLRVLLQGKIQNPWDKKKET